MRKVHFHEEDCFLHGRDVSEWLQPWNELWAPGGWFTTSPTPLATSTICSLGVWWMEIPDLTGLARTAYCCCFCCCSSNGNQWLMGTSGRSASAVSFPMLLVPLICLPDASSLIHDLPESFWQMAIIACCVKKKHLWEDSECFFCGKQWNGSYHCIFISFKNRMHHGYKTYNSYIRSS